jgi:pyrroloquinoline-quinone synthase
MTNALDGRRLLEHPFYQRWEAGELTVDDITQYAQQYRYFESLLPEFLTTLSERLETGVAKESVQANLHDELAEPSHLALFEIFAAHYDAETTAISPAMSRLVAVYQGVLAESDAAAVAGLLAYEMQGAEIAATKSAGLRDFYGATPSATEFWLAHAELEEDHAQWTLDALASLAGDNDVVEGAASRVAQAWWEFLDERDALVRAS